MITRQKSYVAIGSYPKDIYSYDVKRISSNENAKRLIIHISKK